MYRVHKNIQHVQARVSIIKYNRPDKLSLFRFCFLRHVLTKVLKCIKVRLFETFETQVRETLANHSIPSLLTMISSSLLRCIPLLSVTQAGLMSRSPMAKGIVRKRDAQERPVGVACHLVLPPFPLRVIIATHSDSAASFPACYDPRETIVEGRGGWSHGN